MLGLLVKLIVCPITVIVASYIFPNVQYANLTQPIIVGIVLAVSAHLMEVFILKKGTFWISTLADYFAAFLLVYFVSMFMAGAVVTFFGAILTALLLVITEIIQHRWLINSGRTKKSPA